MAGNPGGLTILKGNRVARAVHAWSAEGSVRMITCYLRYVIDPYKLAEFEAYAKLWIPLVNRMGGIHHGYFLPGEGANDIAVALFSFPSLAAYEVYRARIPGDRGCQEALALADRTRCIVSYQRSFMRPVLDANCERPSA